MVRQNELVDALAAIESDVNGFIGASIVDAETGMPLAAKSRFADFDLEAASAYNTEIIKAKQKTLKVLNLDSEVEDMLFTLSDQLHLIKMISPTTFVYLAADREETNHALMRAAVRRHTANIES